LYWKNYFELKVDYKTLEDENDSGNSLAAKSCPHN